ncbi:MAG: hypothetical protein WBK10_09090 [Bacillota bacterium]|jgi:hypothetical protein|nr:hypothetical protein [Bacillota bacterium]
MFIEGTRIRITEGEIREAAAALAGAGDVKVRDIHLAENGLAVELELKSPVALSPRLHLEPLQPEGAHFGLRVSGQLGLGPVTADMAIAMMSARFPPGVSYVGASTIDVDLELVTNGLLYDVDVESVEVAPGEVRISLRQLSVSTPRLIAALADVHDVPGGFH